MEPPNIFESLNYHILDLNVNPDAETLFRRGFEVFTFNSKEYYQNATLPEMTIYKSLMEDYFKYEKIPDTKAFLSLFPSKPSPEILNSEETESSSLQGIEEESEGEIDYIPIEEDFEFSATRRQKNSLSKRSSDSTSFDSSTVQNKMKNHQGTIAGKVKKFCKLDKRTGSTRLFEEATKDLTAEKKEKFRKWALSYQKTCRTWNVLRKFLSSNAEFGGLFATMAILLLSEDFKNEYEECINKGQMGEKTKALLREQNSKDFYIEKFKLTIKTLQGNTHDFENEIKKHRKTQKKS